jgi:hypothetical protein
MLLHLVRVGQSGRGTFGVLKQGQVPFAVTLERPWEQNKQDISCIPAGKYTCRRRRSSKFGDTYEICHVPGREDVLFHWGNYITDTEGCVLIGEEFSGTWDAPFIASSKRGFIEFKNFLADAPEFSLIISDPIATPDLSEQV